MEEHEPAKHQSPSGVNGTSTAMGATEQIRISEEVKRALDEQKTTTESYNDVLERLLAARVDRRREAIRDGAGVWAGSGAATGAREAREALDDELGPEK